MKTNSTAKEQSLNPQPVGRPQTQGAGAEDQLDERVLKALHALPGSRGRNLEKVSLLRVG